MKKGSSFYILILFAICGVVCEISQILQQGPIYLQWHGSDFFAAGFFIFTYIPFWTRIEKHESYTSYIYSALPVVITTILIVEFTSSKVSFLGTYDIVDAYAMIVGGITLGASVYIGSLVSKKAHSRNKAKAT